MDNSTLSKIVSDVVAKVQQNQCCGCSITLAQAKRLINKVEEEAARMGVNAVVAVSNTGARPVAIECMDDSYIASYDVALNKAYTVVALKMSTIQLK